MTDAQGNVSSALTGIRVLDLSRVLAGPWAAQILGDLGAEIIKIEQPGKGDDTRAWGPPYFDDGEPESERLSAYFLTCNRNKQSVAIDISCPAGADLVRKLALECDVVIENFKVGGLKKYGLDYSSLCALRPELVYCSITGFGQDGPYAERGGYDFLIQGMGGLMSVTGPESAPGNEQGAPTKTGVAVVDLLTGMYAAVSILAALRHRSETGKGQQIDCSLLDTSVSMLANQGMNYLVGGIIPRPLGNAHPNVVPYRNFSTSNGEVIIAIGNDQQFFKLCEMLGRADLRGDIRYASNALRVGNRERLERELAISIATWDRNAFLDRMQKFGVPGGPINNLDQVFADPQVAARRMVRSVATAAGNDLPLVSYPAKLSETPAVVRSPPPRLGDSTAKILRQMLKLDEAEIRDLMSRNVISAGKSASPTG